MCVCECVRVCVCVYVYAGHLYTVFTHLSALLERQSLTAEITTSEHDQSLLTYTSNTYLFSPEDSREHRQNCGKNRFRLHHHPSPPFYFP